MSSVVKKGIVLAGGSGSRLYPVTQVACKQLLPVYDKPMIFYPLSTLMLHGISDILIISTPHDVPRFQDLLGDGSRLGLTLSYAVQPSPDGIAQAFIRGEKFIGKDPLVLILGDNIFHGANDFLQEARDFSNGAMVFVCRVNNPQRYGVVEFDTSSNAISIEEKPKQPKSAYAVTGLYIYDSEVVDIAKGLKPSARGELEITDVNTAYLRANKLTVIKLGRDVSWMDSGTHESLLEAGNFIATVEKRQGRKVGCLEETAYRAGLIDRDQLQALIDEMADNDYRTYLRGVVGELDGPHR